MSINSETDINMPTVNSASEPGVDCNNPESVRKSSRKRSQTPKYAEYNRMLQEGDDEEEQERAVTKEGEIGKDVATQQEKEPNDTTDEKDEKRI